MKKFLLLPHLLTFAAALSQSYPPEAGATGSTAIFKESPLYVGWATGISITRGHVNLSNPEMTANGSNLATSGIPEFALGYPDGNTVSLGDRGEATLTFSSPIIDGPGFDLAVLENGGVAYLELAFVEVSSDGINFFRFPSHSQTQTTTQLAAFGSPSAAYLNNLAGKYGAEYGTPFDISELPDDDLLDKGSITHVKIIDVVGSVNPLYASYDSFGNAINESFPTPFASSGFDLQAVGVINQSTLGTGNYNSLAAKFLYPNPAKEHLSVNFPEAVDISIVDISGRIVFIQRGVTAEGMDISTLQPGTYVVKIDFENRVEFRKFIKNGK